MPTGTRIPRGINEFNPYIGNTSDYLTTGLPITNAVRLGITEVEASQWQAFNTEWAPLYIKYSDKKNSRTTAIKDQLLLIIDKVANFDRTYHILDRIASSVNVSIADMETFNIKKGVLQKTTRTLSSTSMNELVTVTIQPIGGGSANIKCYTTTAQRAGIYDDADCVQYLFCTGDTAPESAESAGLTKDLSTKATFTLALGAGAAGKKLFIFFRWYNTKHPELAGPWSGLQTTLLL
jgi:hypothetical protein